MSNQDAPQTQTLASQLEAEWPQTSEGFWGECAPLSPEDAFALIKRLELAPTVYNLTASQFKGLRAIAAKRHRVIVASAPANGG